MIPADDPRRISYHAVTRYVQRILGVVVEGTDDLPHRKQARLHCRELGRTVAELRAEIMSPALGTAIAMRAPQVYTSRFWAAISSKGVVITITAPRTRDRSKLKLVDNRENRALLHRIYRRGAIGRAYQDRS